MIYFTPNKLKQIFTTNKYFLKMLLTLLTIIWYRINLYLLRRILFQQKVQIQYKSNTRDLGLENSGWWWIYHRLILFNNYYLEYTKIKYTVMSWENISFSNSRFNICSIQLNNKEKFRKNSIAGAKVPFCLSKTEK